MPEVKLNLDTLQGGAAREQRDDLIRRLVGMMKRARPESLDVNEPYGSPFIPKYSMGCPFCISKAMSNGPIPTTLEHEDDCHWFEIIKEAEAYEAGKEPPQEANTNIAGSD